MDIVERLRLRNTPYGWLDLADKAADEIERLRIENHNLHGHIYASNQPHPEDLERLRKLLDACRGAMRVTQRVHPNATDWRGMIAAIDSAIGSKETSRRADAE